MPGAGADAEEVQVQPNGVDLSLDAIWRFAGPGSLGRSTDDRRLPQREELEFDADGWIELAMGTYGIRYAEWVALPLQCGGLCFPRSSLLRIATGRDAADTAFMSNYGGAVRLVELSVSAWTDGDLPSDDVNDLVSLG